MKEGRPTSLIRNVIYLKNKELEERNISMYRYSTVFSSKYEMESMGKKVWIFIDV